MTRFPQWFCIGFRKAWAVGFGCGAGGDGPAGCKRANGKALIFPGPLTFPGNVFIRKVTANSGGNAGHKGSRRHAKFRWYERHGGDEATLANFGAIHDDGAHSDKCVFADGASVQDGTMADMAIRFDKGIFAGEAVEDAIVLNICAIADDEATEIATQRGARPDIAAAPNDNIADQDGRWMDKTFRMDNGNKARKTVNNWPWIGALVIALIGAGSCQGRSPVGSFQVRIGAVPRAVILFPIKPAEIQAFFLRHCKIPAC